jgi:hypothetical protein
VSKKKRHARNDRSDAQNVSNNVGPKPNAGIIGNLVRHKCQTSCHTLYLFEVFFSLTLKLDPSHTPGIQYICTGNIVKNLNNLAKFNEKSTKNSFDLYRMSIMAPCIGPIL